MRASLGAEDMRRLEEVVFSPATAKCTSPWRRGMRSWARGGHFKAMLQDWIAESVGAKCGVDGFIAEQYDISGTAASIDHQGLFHRITTDLHAVTQVQNSLRKLSE